MKLHHYEKGKTARRTMCSQIWKVGLWPRGCALLLIACIVFTTPLAAGGNELKRHVLKYADLDLSSRQRALARKHSYLIQYFSSQSYFKPGYTVNSNFIRALMLAESGADQFAISPKNAIGLCQLLYSTADQAAKEIIQKGVQVRYVSQERLRTLQPVDLFDPAVNILLTCYLVAKYNQVYEGRLDLVVAAWNAGQGSIRNGQPPKYPETMNLIGKVNGLLLALNKRGRAVQ